jgi:hypothetical protein
LDLAEHKVAIWIQPLVLAQVSVNRLLLVAMSEDGAICVPQLRQNHQATIKRMSSNRLLLVTLSDGAAMCTCKHTTDRQQQ